MSARLILVSLLAALLLTAGSTVAVAGSAQGTTARAATAGPLTVGPLTPELAEKRLVRRINAARAQHGLAPLVVRRSLRTYARQHSSAMSGQRMLFHTTDLSAVCSWTSVAENVAYGALPRSVHRALMSSAGHRSNILDPDKSAVGIGVVSADGRLWVTQVFRGR